jgi:mannosyl-3-phosphoglycerate phosphatase
MFERMKLIFSDLDGTLLDAETYSPEDAQAALHALHELRIPLILCSSKTRAEMEFWRKKLDNQHPFIVENGAALFIPQNYFPLQPQRAKQRDGYDVIEFGTRYSDLVVALRTASKVSGCEVLGFHDMTVAEISRRTLLPVRQAELAKNREYDEAFEIVGATADRLLRAIESLGKHWTRGGRFYHITGDNDKAVAVRHLTSLYASAYGSVITVGAGDGMNDAGFLNAVDHAIVIRSPFASTLAGAVPRSTITRSAGPHGWNEALLDLLQADLPRFK